MAISFLLFPLMYTVSNEITNSDILKQFKFNSILMDLNYSFTRMSKRATKYDHDDVANGKNESQLVKKY